MSSLRIDNLQKAIAMFAENEENLVDFLTEDGKGKKLVPYLSLLAEEFKKVHGIINNELDQTAEHVIHINHIISTQQRHARVRGIEEITKIEELLESALNVCNLGSHQREITVKRQYDDIPAMNLIHKKKTVGLHSLTYYTKIFFHVFRLIPVLITYVETVIWGTAHTPQPGKYSVG